VFERTTTPCCMRSLLARFRQAVPPHRVSSFVHVGNSLAVCASCSDDMVRLRSFMIGATTCGMCYNLLQPAPLWTPTYWGCFFISAHTIQILRILREQSDVRMTDREHDLYERFFMAHGFTPRQYLALIRESNAKWVTVASGEAMARQGEEVVSLHLVTGGTGCCEVREDDLHDGTPAGGPLQRQRSLQRHRSATDGVLASITQEALSTCGLWVGDCAWEPADAALSSQQHRWKMSVRAVGGSLDAVRFDADSFRAACRAGGPSCMHSAERMQIEALRAHREHTGQFMLKYQARHKDRLRELEEAHLREKAVATYEAMVALAVADGTVTPEEASACAQFRAAHDLGDDTHDEALRKVGWNGGGFENVTFEYKAQQSNQPSR